jgi:hypothetical protein
MEKPANARTIYAWVGPYADTAAFPMSRNPNIGAVQRWQMGFPLLEVERQVRIPGLPKDLNVYRYADMTGRPDLFGDVALDTDTLPRALPALLLVWGKLRWKSNRNTLAMPGLRQRPRLRNKRPSLVN